MINQLKEALEDDDAVISVYETNKSQTNEIHD